MRAILPPETLDDTGDPLSRAFLRRLILGAQLCQLGYLHVSRCGGGGPDRESLDDADRWKLEGTFSAGSAALAFFASDDGRHLVISPVGSNDPGDWAFANIPSIFRRRFPWAPPGIRYGWGFLGQLLTLRTALIESDAFQRAYDVAEHVWIICHSLGGALGLGLRASLSIDAYPKPTTIITYGCPRAWNRAGAEWYSRVDGFGETGSTNTYSVRHCPGRIADLVTRLPPGIWGGAEVGLPVVVSESSVEVGEIAWQDVRRRERIGYWRALRGLWQLRRAIGAHGLEGTIRDLDAAESRLTDG